MAVGIKETVFCFVLLWFNNRNQSIDAAEDLLRRSVRQWGQTG
jgi:hypothetical protein